MGDDGRCPIRVREDRAGFRTTGRRPPLTPPAVPSRISGGRTVFDLNSLVSPHFNWKTAHSLALASDLAYQKAEAVRNLATRNWHLDGCVFLDRGSTQCFVAHTDSAILVAFRGTEALNDWI